MVKQRQLSTKRYFITDDPQRGEPMLAQLHNRLTDLGWVNTANSQSTLHVYTRRTGKRCVQSTVRLLPSTNVLFSTNGKYVTQAKYLATERQLGSAVLEHAQRADIARYKLLGTVETIDMYLASSGVFLSATVSDDNDMMLSEYTELAENSDNLFIAVLDDELYFSEGGDYDYD